MRSEKIEHQIKVLQPLLDMSGFALRHPNEDEPEIVIQEATYWLQNLIDDFMEEFNLVYDLDHTGKAFWVNVGVLGLQSKTGIFSDLDVCIQMRKILKLFKRRCVKNLPVLFGGVAKKPKQPKKEVVIEETDN